MDKIYCGSGKDRRLLPVVAPGDLYHIVTKSDTEYVVQCVEVRHRFRFFILASDHYVSAYTSDFNPFGPALKDLECLNLTDLPMFIGWPYRTELFYELLGRGSV